MSDGGQLGLGPVDAVFKGLAVEGREWLLVRALNAGRKGGDKQHAYRCTGGGVASPFRHEPDILERRMLEGLIGAITVLCGETMCL
jgi:hypothetical protein